MTHLLLFQGITDLLACRGCLATDRNLYNIHQYGLAKTFGSLVGQPVSATDGLPQYLCYYCFALINKFATFRMRCERSQNILILAKLQGILINTDYVKTIDTVQNDLCFPYSQAETQNCSFKIKKHKVLEMNKATGNIDHKYLVDNEHNNSGNIIDNKHYNNAVNNYSKYEVDIRSNKHNDDAKNNGDIEDRKDLKDFFIYNKEDDLKEDMLLFSFNKSNFNDFVTNSDTDQDSVPEYLICDFDDDSKSNLSFDTDKSNSQNEKANFDTEISTDEPNDMNNDSKIESNYYSDFNTLVNSTNYRRELGDVIILNIDEINTFCKDKISLKNESEQMIPKKIKYKPIKKNFKAIKKKFDIRNSYNYNKREDIIKFEKTYHVKVSYLTRAQSRQDVEEKRRSRKYLQSKYPCQICYQSFKNEKLFQSHMAQHESSRGNFVCEFCQCRFKRRSLMNSHMSTHVLRVSCNYCSHVARSYEMAKHHYNWHMGFRYSCEYCGKEYGKSAGLYEHLRNVHVDKMCWCDKCGETFVGETGLRWHVKRAHSEVNESDPECKCTSCGTEFDSVEALRTHIETSTGGVCNTKMRSCVKCGENFETYAVLRMHYMKHRKIDNRQRLRPYCRMMGRKREKKHMCEICGRKFVAFLLLKRHLRSHAGEDEQSSQCSYCLRKFQNTGTFEKHVCSQSGDLPFKCAVCPKVYTAKATLKSHQFRHSAGRSHICHVCVMSFWREDVLTAHLKATHSVMETPNVTSMMKE